MPRSNPFQPSFNSGELTPRLHARTDFSKYNNALVTCENLIPLPEGGLMRRSASRFVVEEKSSSVKGRLKPFEFSTTQAYIIEMGEQIFRFCKDQGQIVTANITASITNGEFTSGISGWTDQSGASSSIAHDATNLRLSLVSNGTTNGHAEQQVTNSSAVEHVLKFTTFGAPGDIVTLRIGTSSTGTEIVNDVKFATGHHCYAFTATAADFYIQFLNVAVAKTVQVDNVSLIDDMAVEISTPYTEAQLFHVNGPQSADTLYLFHPSHPTHKLQRGGHSSWSLIEAAWQDGPWISQNNTATTLTAAAATGLGVTITASATTGINGGDGFKSTDVGRLIRITNDTAANWGWGVIVEFTDTTHVKVDIKRTFVVTTAETTWRLGAWSGTTGYPSVGAFYEQRLGSANNTDQPQTLWMSQTGDFENQAPDSDPTAGTWDGTVQDDDALDYTLSADSVNAIRWLSAGENTFAIGTTGGEWVPQSQGAVLTPSDITIRRQTTHGSANVQPARVGHIVLFVQKAGRKIRELAFSFENDGYRAFDMTRLAQHVTVGGLTELAYAEEPNSLVWAVRADGQLLSMTFRREEDVVGWARHILGGSFSAGDAVVESVAVIPGTDGSGQVQDSTSRDEVWITVKRTINGATKRYIEVLERDYETGEDQEDSYYADSIITYDSTATDTITGLDHLEGETVKIWADGSVHPDRTVSSGSITLDAAIYTVVQVGLGYTHALKTLKLIAGTAVGTPVGKTKQIFGITFVVLNSHTLSFGPESSSLKDIDFREVSDAMDTAVPLFTGERFVEFDDDWETDPRIVAQSDDPAPFTLLALAPETDVKELS